MAKKSSKNKSSKSKAKGKAKKRITWWKIFISLTILCAGVVCFLLRYDGLNIIKDKFDEYLPKSEMVVNLYFEDPGTDCLVGECRKIPGFFSQKQKIAKTLEELVKGPRSTLIRTISPTTVIRDVRIDSNGVVWVDFSSHLSKEHPGGSSAEIMTVYSIVNTILLNFKEVKEVGILIEGVKIETLAGHIDCSRPFVANKDFIK